MDLESLTSGGASEQELRLNDDVNGPSDHPSQELASPQIRGSKQKKSKKRQRPRFEDIEKMELDQQQELAKQQFEKNKAHFLNYELLDKLALTEEQQKSLKKFGTIAPPNQMPMAGGSIDAKK